jgi:hypothetical protein
MLSRRSIHDAAWCEVGGDVSAQAGIRAVVDRLDIQFGVPEPTGEALPQRADVPRDLGDD